MLLCGGSLSYLSCLGLLSYWVMKRKSGIEWIVLVGFGDLAGKGIERLLCFRDFETVVIPYVSFKIPQVAFEKGRFCHPHSF